MHLLFLISGILLCPQAWALSCYDCDITAATCPSVQTDCPAEFTQCGRIRMMVYEGNSQESDRPGGSCFKADQCTTGSFNYGVSKEYFTTKCCNTALCNKEEPPLPNIKSNPNGKKCFRCDGKSDCTGTLNCDGEETYCASTIVSGRTVKGCATKTMCENRPKQLSPYLQQLQCCQGDFCNSSSRNTSAGLLLLTSLTALLISHKMLQ